MIFTFIVTSPYTIYFRNKMQNSDALDKFDGFDISMVAEFLNNYGNGLEPLMTLFIIFIGFYFLFGVYANSAILYAVSSQNKYIPLRPFWNGGLNYYWKIFRLSIYYFVAIVITAIIAWKVLLAIGINVLEVSGDREIIRKFRWAFIILGIVFAVFSIIKQYAKINIAVKNQPVITAAIVKSSVFTVRNLGRTFLLYFVNVLVLILMFFIYVNVRKIINVDAWILTFFLAQVFLLFKIIWRIVHLHSCFDLYMTIQSKSEK